MKRKFFNIIAVFLIALLLIANFSYGIFTPYIYEAEDKSVIAYAELNAATISLPSGERIQSTNINGGTQMNIETIKEPVEIVLIIDRSGSMASSVMNMEEDMGNEIKETRIEVAKKAAISFVENFLKVAENIKISVIAFSSSTSVMIERSSDESAIKSAINEILPGGGTKINPALKEAERIWAKKEKDAHAFLINLTDGATTDSASKSYDKLMQMQKNNIGIYNVLLESMNTEAFTYDGVDAGKIYENASSEDLIEIYEEIYTNICYEIIDNKIDSFIENAQNYFVADNNLFMHLDQEMIQGSRLDLEYIINIKTAFNCTELKLQEEVDKKLNFNESAKMISEDKTNADYGWKVNEDLSYKKYNNSDNYHNLVLSISESSEEDPDKEYIIKKGGTYQVKLLLSCLLTSREDANYLNTLTFEVTEGKKEDDVKGDYNGMIDFEGGNNNNNNTDEELKKITKELRSMEINIIPPFGEEKGYNKIWILILVNLFVGTGIITYLKIKDKSN